MFKHRKILFGFGFLFFTLFLGSASVCHASVPPDTSQYFAHKAYTLSDTDWKAIKQEVFQNSTNSASLDNFPPGETGLDILIGGDWGALEKIYYLKKTFAAEKPTIDVSTPAKQAAWKTIIYYFQDSGENTTQARDAINYINAAIDKANAPATPASPISAIPNGGTSTTPQTSIDICDSHPVFRYTVSVNNNGIKSFLIPNFRCFVGDETAGRMLANDRLQLMFNDTGTDIKLPTSLAQADIGAISRDNIEAWEGVKTLYYLIGQNHTTSDDLTAANNCLDAIGKAQINTAGTENIALLLSKKSFAQQSSDSLQISLHYDTTTNNFSSASLYKYKIEISSTPTKDATDHVAFTVVKDESFQSTVLDTIMTYRVADLKPGWYAVKALITDGNGNNFASGEISSIDYFFIQGDFSESSGMSGMEEGNNTISLDKDTMKPGDTLTVTASFKNKDANAECYLYVDNGEGIYLKQDHKANCTLTWKSGTSTAGGWHTVAVTIADAGGKIDMSHQVSGTTTQSGGVGIGENLHNIITNIVNGNILPIPHVSDTVNVCTGTCSAAPTITITANSTSVKQGDHVAVRASVPDPTRSDLKGKECYIYIGNGAGGWIPKARKSISDCTLDWDTSGTDSGIHGFRANIQDAGRPNGDPTAQPLSNLLYVNVCGKNAAACADPIQPANPNHTGASGHDDPALPNGLSGKLMDIAGIRTKLATPESAFWFFLEDFFPVVIGLTAFISIVIGGIMMIMAAGNEDMVKKAKRAITNGVIGILAAVLSFGIIAAVVEILRGLGLA